MDFSSLEKILFPEMTGWLLAAKIFFILFDLGVIAFIVYVWVTTVYLRRLYVVDLIEFFTFRAYGTRVIDKDWVKIKKRLLSKKSSQWAAAVVESGRLVNDVLKRLNFEGKALSEKLEKPRAQTFSDLAAMIDADAVYRSVAKGERGDLSYEEAKKTILAFEQGLKDVAAFTYKP